MARVLFILGVAVVFFTVYAVVDCLITDRSRVRAIPKPAWVVVIVLLPAIGGILWLAIGKGRNAGLPARLAGAPDDDPAFLHRIGSNQEQEERIRRLEQELADLDDDSKDK